MYQLWILVSTNVNHYVVNLANDKPIYPHHILEDFNVSSSSNPPASHNKKDTSMALRFTLQPICKVLVIIITWLVKLKIENVLDSLHLSVIRHGKKTRTRRYSPEFIPTLTGNTRVDRVWVRVRVFPDNQKSGMGTGMGLLDPSQPQTRTRPAT